MRRDWLFDTQLLIWLLLEPHRFPRRAAAMFSDADSQIFFSTTSVWEVAIKFKKRPDSFTLAPRSFRTALLRSGLLELSLTSQHAIPTAVLPLLHRDPFDRILVAQAAAEGMTLVTADALLTQYSPDIVFAG